MRSRSSLRAITVSAMLAIGVSSLAIAIAGPVEDRQADMKAIGQAMKDGGGLTAPATFDAAKAKAAMGAVRRHRQESLGSLPGRQRRGSENRRRSEDLGEQRRLPQAHHGTADAGHHRQQCNDRRRLQAGVFRGKRDLQVVP